MEKFLSISSTIFIVISVPLVFFYYIRKPKSGERKKPPVYILGFLVVMVLFQLTFFLYHAHKLYAKMKSTNEYNKWENEQNEIAVEFINWRDEQKIMIDEISEKIIVFGNKRDIEDELIRLVEDGLNVNALTVAFSDGTYVSSVPPLEVLEGWTIIKSEVTEKPWYKLAMSAGGKAVSSKFHREQRGDDWYYWIYISKSIGIIDSLNAVLVANIVVPDKFVQTSRHWNLTWNEMYYEVYERRNPYPWF